MRRNDRKKSRQEDEGMMENLPHLWDAYAEAGFGKIHKMRCFRKMDRILQNFFVETRDGQVLDVGCGDGSFFRAILQGIHPAILLGVDWSKKMLERAEKRIQKLQKDNLGYFTIQLEQRDLSEDFIWPDNYFDAVVSHMFSCFVPCPWQNLMGEFYRVTKEGGHIYLTTFLAGWDFAQIVKKHTLGEVLFPFGLYHGLRLKNYPARITEIAKQQGLNYPYREELITFYKKLGAERITEEKIFWGAGIALRVQIGAKT